MGGSQRTEEEEQGRLMRGLARAGLGKAERRGGTEGTPGPEHRGEAPSKQGCQQQVSPFTCVCSWGFISKIF